MNNLHQLSIKENVKIPFCDHVVSFYGISVVLRGFKGLFKNSYFFNSSEKRFLSPRPLSINLFVNITPDKVNNGEETVYTTCNSIL